MTNPADGPRIKALDEPVRRYFDHALRARTTEGRGMRLRMVGRTKVGTWLRFAADWQGDGRSLEWRARAGRGPFRPLRVVDRYSGGQAEMDVRLAGRLRLVHAHDETSASTQTARCAPHT